MNYLQLCQAVRSRIGLHGSGPTTVVAPTEVEKDIVDAVYDAWLDIQNYRPDWEWMRATETFSTEASKTAYTKINIGGVSHRIDRLVPNSLWVVGTDGLYTRMTYIQDEDVFDDMFINESTTSKPSSYTFKKRDNSLKMNSPDGIYSMQIDYWKIPQFLSANTDTPEMPAHWHPLIVYLAVQKLSASIASSSAAFEAAQAYATMMGQLMRDQLKKKKVVVKGIA